jgi:peroxiredoxin Q/BCP
MSVKSAPSFSLPDQNGNSFTLREVSSPYTVVYFYPKDDTPGCTIEAKEFNQALSKFHKRNITVVGISGGDVRSKEKFCGKYKLKVPLLADVSFEVAKKFGAYGKKSFMGRSYEGVLRRTYVLDKSKRIIKEFGSVKPAGHADEVLSFIEGLGNGTDTSVNTAKSDRARSAGREKAAPLSAPKAARSKAAKSRKPSQRRPTVSGRAMKTKKMKRGTRAVRASVRE